MSVFIHTADTHLGYRQYQRPEREQDYLDVFVEIIDAAIEKDCDGVIHAGDLFHDSRPSTDTLRATLEQLRRLRSHDIPFLGVVGNHEGTQNHQWIDLFSELNLAHHLSKSPEIIDETAIYGLDHIPESQQGTLDYTFDPHSVEHTILVTHGLFNPVSPYGTWDISTILDQSPIEFDAVLLGDDHDRRIMDVDDTTVTYAGSPERTATDQKQDRSFNLITTNNTTESTIQVEPEPVDARPHSLITIELSDNDGFGKVKQVIKNSPINDAVVGIVLTGEGDSIPPAQIEEFGKTQGAFAVRVSDRRILDIENIDIDVSFADPDDVIDQHVRGMNLSPVAQEIESRVRDVATTPKSNLTASIEADVTETLESNPADFHPPKPEEDNDTSLETDPNPKETKTPEDEENQPDSEIVASTNEDESGTSSQKQLSLSDLTQ